MYTGFPAGIVRGSVSKGLPTAWVRRTDRQKEGAAERSRDRERSRECRGRSGE